MEMSKKKTFKKAKKKRKPKALGTLKIDIKDIDNFGLSKKMRKKLGISTR